MKKVFLFSNALLIFFMVPSSCSLFEEPVTPPMQDIMDSGGADGAPSIGEGFNYQTFQWVQVTVYTDFSAVEFQIFDERDNHLALVRTDENGEVSIKISVSSINGKLSLRSSYIGLPNKIDLPIENNKVEIDLTSGAKPAVRDQQLEISVLQNGATLRTSGFPSFSVLGDWNRSGVPKYLSSPQSISQTFIEELNSILPEKQPVPEYRPQYLVDQLDTDIHMLADGEIFVTFVHEGAGYRNSLGFYTYTTTQGPPAVINEEDVHIIFPNVSYKHSGGGLATGDTVKIGNFSTGTSVGWVLVSNGYSSRFNVVTNGLNTFYSENDLNPDAYPHKQHIVQIDMGESVVLGFEDLLRPGGDNDFNDAVFSVMSNPVEAIDRSGLIKDTSVNLSESPEEVSSLELKEAPLFEISGYQFFPGKDEFGTLAFEDLWPYKGDYDFNDLVVDYNIVETLNDDNQIIQLQISLRIVGIVASMHNGFGIQLGVTPDIVASVSGTHGTKGYIALEPNGTEKRQQKAVIIAFEDAQAHYSAADPLQSELTVISINFIRGVSRGELGFAPYNPFIMSNGERGREVHLPGYQATSLAHHPYFGTQDDDSVIGTSYMYKTNNDLPWAIHLPERFAYPYDSVKIFDAYTLFEPWVDSDGLSHTDWYTNKSGYRNEILIMRK